MFIVSYVIVDIKIVTTLHVVYGEAEVKKTEDLLNFTGNNDQFFKNLFQNVKQTFSSK